MLRTAHRVNDWGGHIDITFATFSSGQNSVIQLKVNYKGSWEVNFPESTGGK